MIKHEAELIIVVTLCGESMFGHTLYDYREDGGNLILEGKTKHDVVWSQEINPSAIAYMKQKNPKREKS